MEKIIQEGGRAESYSSKPMLFENLTIVWKAFQDLSLSRYQGMGLERIKPADITAWMTAHNISGDELEFFFDMIFVMDLYFIDHVPKRKKDA